MVGVKTAFGTLVVGTALGFALSRIGFSSFDDLHAMFTFADLRMLFSYCGAVIALAVAWPVLARLLPAHGPYKRRPVHRGSLVGGLLFGGGWALCGSCPSIAFVQIGEGQLAALWTVAGIFAGNALYGAVHARYLRWDIGSCNND